MATASQPFVRKMQDEADVIFCCKTSARRAFWSGVIGTLQRCGYTDDNQEKIVKAFRKSIKIYQNDEGWTKQQEVSGQIGLTVYLGLYNIFEHFGWEQSTYNTAEAVIKSLEKMELVDVAATVKDSGVKDHTPRTEEAQKEAAEAKTQALQAIADLGGVFSGTGEPVPGVWSWGSCALGEI